MTRIVFVGPHLGRHDGCVPSPAQDLQPLLESGGHEVRLSSERIGSWSRAWAHVRELVVWRRWADLAVLSVFSGRSFLLAEALSRWMRLLGLRQVHFLHGGGLPDLIAASPDRVRRTLGRADAVVVPSGWLAEAVAPLGLEARVIPNVLDLSRYEYLERASFADPSAPRLLWMRTFHEVYQPELAVRTLVRLREQGLEASLTMAGQDKGLLEPCRALASELGLAERVEFVGFLDPEGKRGVFAEHDIFLNTNRVDNTPVTVLEAMASGLPVVATAVGGVPHVLEHGAAGRLIPNRGAEATARALADAVLSLGASLASDPGSVSELSRTGRRVAEGCSWPAVRELWACLFDDLQT